MAYPLQSMLTIREMREDRARTDLMTARRARLQAEEERNKKQEALDAYNETKESRRDRVYDAVMGRVVTLDELDSARDAVTIIDEEGLLLDEARAQAQEVLDKRTGEVETARIKFVSATKNKLKIEEHKNIWETEDRKEQERLQDAEMEEFTGKKPDIGELNAIY